MDTLTSMMLFRRVVEAGSFSAVAREAEMSQPTVSKHVASLEKRLGTRLLTRSTRQINLTDAGREHYEYCTRILDDLAEAEASVRSGATKTAGNLRISACMSFGRIKIIPHLWKYLAQHPDLKFDLILDDRNIDLVREGIDLVIRVGPMVDSSLVAQKIGEINRVAFASPDYLATHGQPKTPEDLKNHECLVFTLLPTRNRWQFIGSKGEQEVQVHGRFRSNSPEGIRDAAAAGMGIGLAPLWLIERYVNEGKLKRILTDYHVATLDIHAAYPDRRFLPKKVRSFIEHLKATL